VFLFANGMMWPNWQYSRKNITKFGYIPGIRLFVSDSADLLGGAKRYISVFTLNGQGFFGSLFLNQIWVGLFLLH